MDNNHKNKKIEQPSLSEDQLEFFASELNKKNEDRSKIEPFDQSTPAQAVRYAKKHKTSTAVLITAIVSFVVVLVVLAVYAITAIFGLPNKSDFQIVIGDEKFTSDYEDTVIDGVVYIDMNKLLSIDGITVSGNESSLKYTLPNFQYVRFENEKDYAVVDGKYVSMGAAANIKDEMCLVPYEFMKKITQSGLKFMLDKDENKITISRIKIGEENNDTPIYDPITFTNENIDELNIEYDEFNINYDLYKDYIDPNSDEYLILVNHTDPLSSSYIPNDLVQLTCATNPANPDPTYYQLRSVAEKALGVMMQAMKNSNIDGTLVSSSYRSYERQVYLMDNYIESTMRTEGLSYEEAKAEVLKTLAIPGHSEHQTGLAVDFVQGTRSLTTDFEKTSSFAWLSKNAHKFGFILRYPADKVDITGYDYEPWHFRFVGRTVASRIYEANISYEEYVALNS